jgi:dicarboxylate/amino acid:cation (Na+ or H+) symporter, DAACS family
MLHKKLLAALFLAIILGLGLHPYSDLPWLVTLNTHVLQPVGQIFLRLIFMVVVPLIVSALILATHELTKSHGLGRVAIKTLGYTLVISTLSVIIGISLVNTLKPGQGFRMSPSAEQTVAENAQKTDTIKENALKTKPASQIIVELLPKNPIDSATRALDGEMIPLMIFSLIFGIALSLSSKGASSQHLLVGMLDEIYQASMRVMHMAMHLAPFAVFALVFNTVFRAGFDILVSLLFYVVVVLLGLLIQQFVVYAFMLKFFAKRNPWKFFKEAREVYLYAFSTSSSNATLPKALETAETRLSIPSHISRFVLTVGASANQNGTAIFEGITVLFLAQVYGIDLSLSQQVYVVLFSILAGVGTAGVPGGSLPLIMVLLQSVGIPAEGIGLILGVDRFLDMCRTTINVSGDLVIAALVAHGTKPVTIKTAHNR